MGGSYVAARSASQRKSRTHRSRSPDAFGEGVEVVQQRRRVVPRAGKMSRIPFANSRDIRVSSSSKKPSKLRRGCQQLIVIPKDWTRAPSAPAAKIEVESPSRVHGGRWCVAAYESRKAHPAIPVVSFPYALRGASSQSRSKSSILENPAREAASSLAGREWCSKEPREREAMPSAGGIGCVRIDGVG